MLTGCTNLEFDHESIKVPFGKYLEFENPDECDEKYRNDVESGVENRGNHTDKTQGIILPLKLQINNLLENNVTAYLYEYTYPKHGRHTDDLSYIMGVHAFEKDENEVHLEQVYKDMVINFIKLGEPGMGFEKSEQNESTYFDIYWNETTGERPRMRKYFEKEVTDYWLKEMIEFDQKVTETKKKLKQISLKTVPFIEKPLEQNDEAGTLIGVSLIAISIFLIGCIFGRYCCLRRRNLYIRLDGNNYENAGNF
ncbi:Carboxylesterase type B domain-containing protein [Caenorhabditis elegans]|nr:Carboxylesterase type B domain-containing protein [Caenorhabditis elegans]CDK13353.1 Carboxylesterase type B domain-containing protein [Caenorhabditis elegans]|eukprot:NP_001293701.1 Uncharacterized protein CELE_C01B10.4 [Caenorhabditis elegans]